jgi:Fe-S-cluster-containing dehydrogenase component
MQYINESNTVVEKNGSQRFKAFIFLSLPEYEKEVFYVPSLCKNACMDVCPVGASRFADFTDI